MKTKLALLAATFATALPASLAADSAGVALPPVLDSLHLLGAFAASLVLLTVFADYGRGRARFAGSTRHVAPAAPRAKAAHALAA